MIRRLIAVLLLLWSFGFIAFAIILPKATANQPTEGVVVLTGGQGRVQRGVAVLENHLAKRLLISGVDKDVKLRELVVSYHIPKSLAACCIDLGRQATDTQSNASETAAWVKKNGFQSLRIVTNNWHMTRAHFEIATALPASVTLVDDPVNVPPSIGILLQEYNKYLWRRIAVATDSLA